MAVTPDFPMPWPTTQCAVWLAYYEGADAYGNEVVTYNEDPDWVGGCMYWPGRGQQLRGMDDIEQSRPYGAEVRITVYLPQTFALDPRRAMIAVYPDDDPVIYGHKYTVIGEPMSTPRAITPGDYSWAIEAGDHIG